MNGWVRNSSLEIFDLPFDCGTQDIFMNSGLEKVEFSSGLNSWCKKGCLVDSQREKLLTLFVEFFRQV
jgi:hypothetical protein